MRGRLGIFHHSVACRMMVKQSVRQTGGIWDNPPYPGGGNEGHRPGGGGGLCCETAEHGGTLYYDAANTRPVHGGGELARSTGV